MGWMGWMRNGGRRGGRREGRRRVEKEGEEEGGRRIGEERRMELTSGLFST